MCSAVFCGHFSFRLNGGCLSSPSVPVTFVDGAIGDCTTKQSTYTHVECTACRWHPARRAVQGALINAAISRALSFATHRHKTTGQCFAFMICAVYQLATRNLRVHSGLTHSNTVSWRTTVAQQSDH